MRILHLICLRGFVEMLQNSMRIYLFSYLKNLIQIMQKSRLKKCIYLALRFEENGIIIDVVVSLISHFSAIETIIFIKKILRPHWRYRLYRLLEIKFKNMFYLRFFSQNSECLRTANLAMFWANLCEFCRFYP